MYERSAVILEKYFAEKFGYNEKSNLKSNHKNYCNLVEILEKYQEAVVTEDQIIKECEDIVNVLKQVQSRQASLYRRAIRLQEDRSQIFEDIDEPAENIEKTLIKIEKDIDKNSEEMKPIDLEFTNTIKEFSQKAKQDQNVEKVEEKLKRNTKQF